MLCIRSTSCGLNKPCNKLESHYFAPGSMRSATFDSSKLQLLETKFLDDHCTVAMHQAKPQLILHYPLSIQHLSRDTSRPFSMLFHALEPTLELGASIIEQLGKKIEFKNPVEQGFLGVQKSPCLLSQQSITKEGQVLKTHSTFRFSLA